MTLSGPIIAKLYSPLILAATCFIAAASADMSRHEATLHIQPVGQMLDIAIPAKAETVTRILLSVAGVLCLGLYAMYDYSSLFPQHFRMEVFFDEAGIKQSLRSFGPVELRRLGMVEDFEDLRKGYLIRMGAASGGIITAETVIGESRSALHSTGDTTFVVQRIQGWQNYHIVDAHGEMTHILEAPDAIEQRLYTFFEKLPSKGDYVSLSAIDIYWHWGVVLSPRFKQILTTDRRSEGTTFKAAVVGVSKLHVFPMPCVRCTLYCAAVEGAGLVPVAYGLYR